MRLIFAALALFLFGCSSLLAQQAAQPAGPKEPPAVPDSGIRIHAASRLVIVDVVVTDSNGNPIHNLKPEDFKLTENSAHQEIRDFEEVTPAKPLAAGPKMPPLPPNVYTNYQQAPDSAPAINLLLLDALNTPVADQIYVRQQMLKYLKAMPPSAHIAIFTLSSQLRILQGFTTDSSALVKALNSPAATPRSSALLENPFEPTLSDQFPLAGVGLERFEAENSTARVDLRVQETLDALTSISAYLSGIPGRKNLIWFSASFPLNLLPESDLATGGFSVARNYSSAIRAVTDALTLNQIAIYPIDARGLFTSQIYNAENSGTQYANRSGSTRFSGDSAGFSRGTASEMQAMDQIAKDTGGHAFYSTNDLQGALRGAIENGSNYYRLTYSPTNKKTDGTFRKISVAVPHSSYKLSYRRGYLADDFGAEKEVALVSATPLQTAMRPSAPVSTQIVFKARVLPADELPEPLKEAESILPKASVTEGKTRKYVIDYVAAMKNIAFSVTPDGLHHGSIDVLAIAYDATGKTIASNGGHFNAGLNAPTFADFSAGGMPLRQELYLPVGNLFLRLGIQDSNSGRVGSLEIPLHVAATKTKEPTTPASPSPGAQPSASLQ